MDAQEMIRQYKAIDKPIRQYGVKRSKWMDNLGKIDITLPVFGALLLIGAILLLKKRGKLFMLQFFIGVIVGAVIGITMVALCISSKNREDIYTQDDFYREQKYK